MAEINIVNQLYFNFFFFFNSVDVTGFQSFSWCNCMKSATGLWGKGEAVTHASGGGLCTGQAGGS